jgi:hypothetical protein
VRTYEHPGACCPKPFLLRSHRWNELRCALLSQLIRHFSGDWLRGVRRFAYIMYPYVMEDDLKKRQQTSSAWPRDTRCACSACSGGEECDASARHPEKSADELGEDDGFEKHDERPWRSRLDSPDRIGLQKE